VTTIKVRYSVFSFLNLSLKATPTASTKDIAESIASKNTVIKNITANKLCKAGNKFIVSGIVTNTKEGHPATTFSTGNHFCAAKYPNVPNTAIADKDEIRVFHNATMIVL
jgi:hypothetical protein